MFFLLQWNQVQEICWAENFSRKINDKYNEKQQRTMKESYLYWGKSDIGTRGTNQEGTVHSWGRMQAEEMKRWITAVQGNKLGEGEW